MTILHLPLPPKEASPNWRGHWARKASANREYRELVGWLAKEPRVTHAARVRVKYIFRFTDRRRRDPDNLVASMKAGLDGCRDAGLIRGDTTQDVVLEAPQLESGAETNEVVVEILPDPPAGGRLEPRPYDQQPEVVR